MSRFEGLMMHQLSYDEEAENCRRKALTYLGKPEAPFLLRLAKAFDDLHAQEKPPRR